MANRCRPIANVQLLAKRLPLDQIAVQARTDAVRIATAQYKAGRRDLLWVSNLQTSQLANEADLIKLRGMHMSIATACIWRSAGASMRLPRRPRSAATECEMRRRLRYLDRLPERK